MKRPKQIKKSMEPRLRPEIKRHPRITPEAERIARADAILQEVSLRYSERYKGESELLGYAMKGLRTFLTDYVPTPRPSGHEEQITENSRKWAHNHGLYFEVDRVGNSVSVLRGDPTKVIVLQGHKDIVAAATEDSPTHPATDSIIPVLLEGKERTLEPKEVYDEELWLHAENGQNSLGADNGAGDSANRAVMERLIDLKQTNSRPDEFPTILVLETVREEAHLEGAKHIAKEGTFSTEVMDLLSHAAYIINDDMEIDNPQPLAIDGSFGLEALTVTYTPHSQPLPEGMTLLSVNMTNFLGGHSGLYAERNHAGAILIQQLQDVLGAPGERLDWRLSSLTSGEADNQIAQNAHAVIAVPISEIDALSRNLELFSDAMQQKVTEEAAAITVHPVTKEHTVLTDEDSRKVFHALSELANFQGTYGEFECGPDQHVYRRAFNLGIVQLDANNLSIAVSTRIGRPEEYDYFPPRVKQIAYALAAEVTENEPTQIWPTDTTSPLPDWIRETYRDLQFPKAYPDLVVQTVKAGLELGELHERFPQSRNITLGMWIDRIHKPGERMQIPAFLENTMLLMKFTDKLVNELMNDSVGESSRRG